MGFWNRLRGISGVSLRKLFLYEPFHYEGQEGPLSSSFSEFLLHYEPVRILTSINGIPTDFSYRHFGLLFQAKILERKALVIQAECRFPNTLIVRDHLVLHNLAGKLFMVEKGNVTQWQADTILADSMVQRQLHRIREFPLIVLSRQGLLSACYTDLAEYSGINLSRYTNALYNLNLYAARAFLKGSIRLHEITHRIYCPYCKEIADGGGTLGCEKCGTIHHLVCWEENGGCSIFGCC